MIGGGEQAETTWYGELYAIHKLKVAATKLVLISRRFDKPSYDAAETACKQAIAECHELGLTDEILLERLKI